MTLYHYKHAITRRPPLSMANGETTQTSRPDSELARKQHEQYCEELRRLNIEVTVLEAEEGLPDSHFVEDTAIICDGTAILTRPGAASRRAEVEAIKPHLQKHLPVIELGGDASATVDGGDVLMMGEHVFIGLSQRTNMAGAKALADIIHTVSPQRKVHLVEFDGVLHLKSGIVAMGAAELLGNPKMKLKRPLPLAQIKWLPEEEGYAANALIANGAAFIFAESDAAHKLASEAGLKPIRLDMSEFRKMDGSFTCLSLLW